MRSCKLDGEVGAKREDLYEITLLCVCLLVGGIYLVAIQNCALFVFRLDH